jgi:CRP-like cAMP-binding protein
MLFGQSSAKIGSNRLLLDLPRDEANRLAPHLQLVSLKKGTTLYHAEDKITHCYFPLNGMLSLLSATGNDKTIELAMIGSGGMIGIAAVLQMNTMPYHVQVQIQADALRVKTDVIQKEFNRGGEFQRRLLRHLYALLRQISQSAVCHRFHTVEERLCRWLLISRDRMKSNQLHLTQESISQMLGVPRTNVTMTALVLQRAGLINYRRGLITITDVKGLEEAACECFSTIKKEFDDFEL